MAKILFTVTNDLNFDQRMQRICGTLQQNGYDVTLIGRASKKSPTLSQQIFKQKRLHCRFVSGALFYIEYNIKLFLYLLFQRTDILCAIDLDTILPVYFASVIRNCIRVYDAHEYFTEMKEIVSRPKIHKIWSRVEMFAVPRFQHGYTVNQTIADLFREKYNVHYAFVRNFAKKTTTQNAIVDPQPFILYQGAVNEGREFEALIPAMKRVKFPLHIYGSGNFVEQVKQLIKEHNVEDKVIYFGKKTPAELREITPTAYLGILLMDRHSMNNYYSLANRFTDYMMAGIPQICVDFPEYRKLNDLYGFADLIDNVTSETLAAHITHLIDSPTYREQLQQNAIKASTYLCWEVEEKVLIQFYKNLLSSNDHA